MSALAATIGGVDHPFLGSEDLSDGSVANKHQLRTRFRAVYPNVYLPHDCSPTLSQRATAAWLWSGRRGIVSGLAASAVHGAKWIADEVPIQLIWRNPRPPTGIETRRDSIGTDETVSVGGMAVTSVDRTAYDLGRLIAGDEGVARLDALGNATGFRAVDVLALADRHPGSPGIPRLRRALGRYDAGAESPRETWLRLLLVRAGFPRPRTQIPICDETGRPIYFLDMGWEDAMVAVEYDGDQHRQRTQWRKDIVRSEYVAHRRWSLVRVVACDRPVDVVNRVRRAWVDRAASSVRSDRESA